MITLLRSLAINAVFYLNTVVCLLLALPTFFMPYTGIVGMAKLWGRTNLWLLALCGLRVEIRGAEKIPKGLPMMVAAKHQSAWETFALLPLFDNPFFILKRELQWIPLFGWFLIKGRMVAVDRKRGSRALVTMTERAIEELLNGRQLIIFPEGTRRPAGAEPRYKFGVAHLYATLGVPCLPVALNAGLFWPRRSFLRYPGTVVIEVLDMIEANLDKEVFFQRIQDAIEPASARLIAEAKAKDPSLRTAF